MNACEVRDKCRKRVVRHWLGGTMCGFALAVSLFALPGQALAEEAAVSSDEVSAVAIATLVDPAVEEGAAALADDSRTVYVSRSGSRYHFSPTCSGMKNPTSMPLSDAVAKGKTACGTCATGSSGGSDPAPTPKPDPSPAPMPDPAPTPTPDPVPPVTDVASATLSRLAGPIALDTMQAITTKGFADGSCPTVVVATMSGYWDALTASALAGLSEAPVLLTDGDSLSPQTAAEIRRLNAKEVLVTGGTSAISVGVARQIEALGNIEVKRYAGSVATQTAIEIFKASKDWGDTAIVATSKSFHDALSIAPFAYANHAPIFLAEADSGMLSGESLAALKSGGFKQVCIVGGTAAVSGSVEGQLGTIPSKRLWGATAYETSEAIASWCVSQGMKSDGMGIATGGDYYDALAGAALCGKGDAVIVLVSDDNRVCVNGFIGSHAPGINAAYVFGGPAAVSAGTFNAVASMLR